MTTITAPRPAIGRIVHVRNLENGEISPAVITRVHSATCVDVAEFQNHHASIRHRSSLLLGRPGELHDSEFQWGTRFEDVTIDLDTMTEVEVARNLESSADKPQSDPANVEN